MTQKKKLRATHPVRIFCAKLKATIKEQKLKLQPLGVEMGLTSKSLSNIMWSGRLSRRAHDAIVARLPELKGIVEPSMLEQRKPRQNNPIRVVVRKPPRPAPFELRAGKEYNVTTKNINVNDAFKLGATLTNLGHQKGGQLWIEGLEAAARMGLEIRDVVTQLKGTLHAG